jgi:hypothetical protein
VALAWRLHGKSDWIPNYGLRSRLEKLRPQDIDYVELKGLYMSLPDEADPKEQTAFGYPNIVSDKAAIATFLRVFRDSGHRPAASEAGAGGNSSDEITFKVHGMPYGIVAPIDGVLVADDYGPEVAALYEKYRQRPWFPWDVRRKRQQIDLRKRGP